LIADQRASKLKQRDQTPPPVTLSLLTEADDARTIFTPRHEALREFIKAKRKARS
jgi:hypothetical protein